MDDFRTYSSTSRFDPPEEGMMPGESIVWTRKPGYEFWILCVGLPVLIGLPLVQAAGIVELSFNRQSVTYYFGNDSIKEIQ